MSKQDAKWIKKDDVTIEGAGAGSSGNLRVKDDGIDENKINSTAITTDGGLTGGSGSTLELDIPALPDGPATVADDDELVIYDQDAGDHVRVRKDEFLAGSLVENKQQEMHTITAGIITAGLFNLSATPSNRDAVSITPVGGPQQVNYRTIGGTGATPDFDLNNGADHTEVQINDNAASGTNLQPPANMDWTAGDVVIVEYPI
jgi:hypothetical protein